MLSDEFEDKIEAWMDRSAGMIQADVVPASTMEPAPRWTPAA